HNTWLTLELGGKSPTIIDSEYDLMDAAKKIAVGKFVNANQTKHFCHT
ncbi:aldehyde dehydrogenase family protein, partial [Bacillus sp. FJAT-27445]